MATKDGRAQIWYADGSGNVTGYTESVDDIAGTIIDAYNEHFGTDIEIWTPETKTLQVGDTVPNWNAYEKIVLPPSTIEYIGVRFSEGRIIAGYISGGIAYYYGANEYVIYLFNESGIRAGQGGGQSPIPGVTWAEGFENTLRSIYGNILKFEAENNQGSTSEPLENWSNYIVHDCIV